MTQEEVLELLRRAGVFHNGHFVFISGQHSGVYLNKDALYPDTRQVSRLCEEIARRFATEKVEAVIGPAVGAAILSQWTARHLSEMGAKTVHAAYADKSGDGGFVIKRGYDKLLSGMRTLVVEDNITTGGSVRKVAEAARACGADVVGVMAICNRGAISREAIGVPRLESLLDMKLEQWPAPECPLCAAGVPLSTDLGHGRELLARGHAGYTKDLN